MRCRRQVAAAEEEEGFVFHQLTVEMTVITEGLWLPRAGDTAGNAARC